MSKRLYRRPEQGQIAGVAAGFADYFEMDPTVMRVIFIVAIFVTSGWAILLYFLMALILPVEGSASASASDRLNELTEQAASDRTRNWLGIGLIALGGWFLITYLWPGWLNISWRLIWSLALIFVGVAIIAKGRK